MDHQNPFKWRHSEADIILLCVHQYIGYSLSYRDLKEMMRERGLLVDHTTIYRSRPMLCPRTRQTMSPISERLQRFAGWVDETYIKVAGTSTRVLWAYWDAGYLSKYGVDRYPNRSAN